MNRASKTLLLAAAAAIVTTSISLAAEPTKRSVNSPLRQDGAAAASGTAATETRAIGGAASTARLAALIDQGGAVIRSKGVARVTRPGTGRYCILPRSDSGVNPNNIVPTMSVDFSNSSYPESTVQYRSSGDGCPVGYIAVLTFADVNLDARYGLVNSVAFTIVVD